MLGFCVSAAKLGILGFYTVPLKDSAGDVFEDLSNQLSFMARKRCLINRCPVKRVLHGFDIFLA